MRLAAAATATPTPAVAAASTQTDAFPGDEIAANADDPDGGGSRAAAAARAAAADRDSAFVAALAAAAGAARAALRDNEVADVWARPLGGGGCGGDAAAAGALRSAGGLTPAGPAARLPVTALAWTADGNRLAVSHAGEPGRGGGGAVVLWDPATARAVAAAPSPPAASIAACPRDAALLVLGLDDGGVAVLDARAPALAAARAPPGAGHRGPAHGAVWPASRLPADVATCGDDGCILWWDGRALAGGPLDRERARGRGAPTAPPPPTRALAAAGGGTGRLLVATDHGTVLTVTRGARPPADRVGAAAAGARAGPILSLDPHPTLPRVFLTAGDGGAAVWSEDARWPLQGALGGGGGRAAAGAVAARWSPTRPAVFYALSVDGTVTAHDVRSPRGEGGPPPPSARGVRGAGARGTALRPSAALLAVGGSDGRVDLLRATGGLAAAAPGERADAGAALDREAERERGAERAAREARRRAHQGGGGSGGGDRAAAARAADAAEAALLAAVGGSAV